MIFLIAFFKMKKSNYFISFLLLVGFLTTIIDFSIPKHNSFSNNYEIVLGDIHKKNCNNLHDNIPSEESSEESDNTESETNDDELEKELKFFSNNDFTLAIQSSSLIFFGDTNEHVLSHYLEIPLMPPEYIKAS